MRYRSQYSDPLYNERQERMIKNKADSFIDSHPMLRDNHKQIGGFLIAVCIVIIVITVAGAGIKFYRQSLIKSYTPVTATVTNVEMRSHRHTRTMSYDYKMNGTYEVDGVSYQAYQIVDTYRLSKASTFTVYYNPSKPSDYVAESSPKSIGNTVVTTLVICLVFGIAIYFLFRYMKYGRIKTKPDYMDYINEYTNGGNEAAARMYEQQNGSGFDYYKSPQEQSGGSFDFYKSPEEQSGSSFDFYRSPDEPSDTNNNYPM